MGKGYRKKASTGQSAIKWQKQNLNPQSPDFKYYNTMFSFYYGKRNKCTGGF